MKIELELPDWVDERQITILAGMELVAEKHPSDNFWYIKTIRCSMCGQCCMTLSNGNVPFPVDDEGKCSMLEKSGDRWICKAGYFKPFCCLGDTLKSNTPECSIVHKKVMVD